MRPAPSQSKAHRAQRGTTFVIFDSTANLVDSFDDVNDARARLTQIAGQDQDAASEYALLEFDASGTPVSDALTVADFDART